MIVGKKYVASEINARYDAIVIGSGLGGLTTAALLAKAGKSVLVLERHYTAGGFTHSFQRKGYEWDVGVHYIGEVHRPDSPLRRVFDCITEGKLQWAKMDAVYDRILIAGDEYAFVAGARNFREELLRSFPKEGEEIDAYLHHIRQASRSIATHFARRHMPAVMQSALEFWPQKNRIDYFGRTTHSVMADFIHDPRLASVLCGQWGDYGLPPRQSSFGMHAVVAQHYLGGANFPVGGASQIAHHIEPVITRAGGSVRVNAEVETILLDKDCAIGVRMANGDEILATQVISAVGLFNTYQKLIPESVGQRLGMPEKLARFKPSMAHLGLYLGIKGTAQELGLEQANRWVYQDYDHDASLARFLALPGPNGAFPVSFLSFPSAKDPAWTHNHPGTATIDVVAPAPYQWFEPWQHMPWKHRGADYEAFKQSLSEQLLAEVYRQVPQVRGKVDYCELSTPLSTAHFGNYAQGQVYGMDHSPQRFAQSWVKPTTPIKNFYLTGQDIMTCGVAAAMMAGVMTAINALGTGAMVLLPEVLAPQRTWGRQVTQALSRLGRTPLSNAKAKLAPPEPKACSFTARCVARVPLSHDVVALRFTVTDGALSFKPGQFVTLALDINAQQHFRSYTIASSPAQNSEIELIVKRVDQGLVSNWLCDTVQPGTLLAMSGPHGTFTCAPHPRPKLLLLSAGSGVTPMLSMARWLRDSGTRSDVVFFHSARTTQDLICDDEVQALAQTLPHFVRHISLTRSARTIRTVRNTFKGHIDAAMLHAIAPDFMEREVYVCGPQGFMVSVREILQTARFVMRHHHEENFDASVKASGGRVSFARSGFEVDAAGEVSLLDIAQQAGVSIASACRTGDCGECKAKKCSGEVLMANTAGLAAGEEDEGYVLTCVGYANGTVTLDA